jgi:succinoglycan biosynthesis transport protein ExoP
MQTQLDDLGKDANAQREVLQALLARVEQTSSEPHGTPQLPGARIISSADMPVAPSAPRPKLVAAIGMVAGLALGGRWPWCVAADRAR